MNKKSFGEFGEKMSDKIKIGRFSNCFVRTEQTKNIFNEGLFLHISKPMVWSKKSDSGCYSLRSFTQPCEPLHNDILNLRGFAKW
jgi:hypothetical protein